MTIPASSKVVGNSGHTTDHNLITETLSKHTDTSVYDVVGYGALGDGTTDDTTLVQAAITAAPAGATVTVPPRTYIISAPLTMSGQIIRAHGATFKHKASVTAFNMFTSTSTPFEIHGLTIDMNKANVSAPSGTYIDTEQMGVYIAATAGYTGIARFQHVTVKNCHGAGIRVGTSSSSSANPLSNPDQVADVSDCTFDNVKYGPVLVGCTDSTISNNSLTDITTDGIYDVDSTRTACVGNRVYTAGRHGILFEYSRQFTCQGNIVRAATSIGICVGGGDPARNGSDKFSITGNSVYSCNIGMQIDPTKSDALTTEVAIYATISGNTVNNNTVHGIYVQECKYAAITANTCNSNGNAGIAVVGSYVTVTGNACVGNDTNIALWGHEATKGRHNVAGNMTAAAGTTNYTFDVEGLYTTELLQGTGTPESAVKGHIGAVFQRADGGAYTSLYVKESGTGTTGWVPAVTSPPTWTSYTPGLSGGTAAIGNGTVSAKYAQFGKTVFFKLKVTRGTTTTFGSTNLVIGLPPVTATSTDSIVGSWRSLRTGVAFYTGVFYANTTTQVLPIFMDGTARGYPITDSDPYAWATGDWIELQGFYEAV